MQCLLQLLTFLLQLLAARKLLLYDTQTLQLLFEISNGLALLLPLLFVFIQDISEESLDLLMLPIALHGEQLLQLFLMQCVTFHTAQRAVQLIALGLQALRTASRLFFEPFLHICSRSFVCASSRR